MENPRKPEALLFLLLSQSKAAPWMLAHCSGEGLVLSPHTDYNAPCPWNAGL